MVQVCQIIVYSPDSWRVRKYRHARLNPYATVGQGGILRQMSTVTPAIVRSTLPRHSAVTRVTHWLTFVAFLALLLTGIEILISHPRFYLGETGNAGTKAFFTLPIPASRATVPTRFGYVLPDQNGWSRYLHFEAAWLLVITGAVYLVAGLVTRHIRRDLVPGGGGLYNPLQRITYLLVIFCLFPLLIWTGLAMSPAFTAAFPMSVVLLGGRQTARTLHFVLSIGAVLFVVGHVTMVVRNGFWTRILAMMKG
jgi:thiosulfate reductase cytochrome b subunit